MDGAGNINVNAPNDIAFTAGKNMNINVGQNMTTNVGMNKSSTIGMNNMQSVGMMKMTSVVGDASMFVTGKFTEMIEGDVHSETKKGKTIVNNDAGVETSSNSSIIKHAQNEVQNNSAEKSKSH